jgi:hypothetical protein
MSPIWRQLVETDAATAAPCCQPHQVHTAWLAGTWPCCIITWFLMPAPRPLQIKGDVRLIHSNIFAADYSMRFPTVVRTRWDKPAAEVQTHEELCQLVKQRVEAGGCGPCATSLSSQPHCWTRMALCNDASTCVSCIVGRAYTTRRSQRADAVEPYTNRRARPSCADAVIRPSDGGGGRPTQHRGGGHRRAAKHRSGPLPEKLTPIKRANVMDQVLYTLKLVHCMVVQLCVPQECAKTGALV